MPLVWPIFLTQLCISFQTPVGEKKGGGGGFVISFSQMILAPVLSSVGIKRFEWRFFQGSWYPAGGSINWAHFPQTTLQGHPPLKRSRRKKNLGIITNVAHIAIRLHLSHIDNRHFFQPAGKEMKSWLGLCDAVVSHTRESTQLSTHAQLSSALWHLSHLFNLRCPHLPPLSSCFWG